MARIEGEIAINRPVDEVFDFVADGRNEPAAATRGSLGSRSSRQGPSAAGPGSGLRPLLGLARSR